MEPNDCIPPSYSQCRLHNNGHSAPDTAPSDSNSHTRHHKQKTPESPPPNYEAILALSKDLSPFYRQYATTKDSASSASPQSAGRRSYQSSRRGTRQNSTATTPSTPQDNPKEDNIELNYVEKTWWMLIWCELWSVFCKLINLNFWAEVFNFTEAIINV